MDENEEVKLTRKEVFNLMFSTYLNARTGTNANEIMEFIAERISFIKKEDGLN